MNVADEKRIMKKRRMTLFTLFLFSLVIFIALFRIRIDLRSLWVIRIQNGLECNIFYFSLVIILMIALYMHIEPFLLIIRRYDIRVRRCLIRPIKIVQISDTHVHYPYPQVTKSRLISIINKINKEDPDFVVFTGDLMSDGSKHAKRDIETIISALKLLRKPLYVCFGNHDVECHDLLKESLIRINAHVLEQETDSININGSTVYISGIKPSLILEQTNDYVSSISQSFGGNLANLHILLAHMPDAADAAASSRIFDVQLSGHSHGGQCVLPLGGGTPWLPPGSLKYHACLTSNYKVLNMFLHISRGVGVTPLPFPLIRFFCPPEISVLTIIPHDF